MQIELTDSQVIGIIDDYLWEIRNNEKATKDLVLSIFNRCDSRNFVMTEILKPVLDQYKQQHCLYDGFLLKELEEHL